MGSDKPGSVVELLVQDSSGVEQKVKLQRMARTLIQDKRKLFELFSKITDRGRKDKDMELVQYADEATELWTQMMIEEHSHSQTCIHNVLIVAGLYCVTARPKMSTHYKARVKGGFLKVLHFSKALRTRQCTQLS